MTDEVSKLAAEMTESQNARDKRVEDLWRTLDPQGHGELDLKGLQKGLKRIDHPMKNADNMLKAMFKAVDTNCDGKIQYEEFRVFVEAAEKQLLVLFRSIDRDNNGRLDKQELRTAFQKNGITVSAKRLHGFFDEIDLNRDGYITFEEWRDFLLFMPSHLHDGEGGSVLAKALSFYSQIVTINAEGDSLVSDETLEGLDSALHFISSSPQSASTQPSPPPGNGTLTSMDNSSQPNSNTTEADLDLGASEKAILEADDKAHSGQANKDRDKTTDKMASENEPSHPVAPQKPARKKGSKLTEYLPEPGYFLAGAIAGGVSRTATAPLDRLKVYLLVNTTTKTCANAAIQAATKGQPLTAVKKAGFPITTAMKSLYRSGGLVTFFAGNGLNVIKIMPETAIKFGSYEFAKRTLATLEGHNDPSKINPYSKFLAGGVAGMVAQFCVYPLDTLKFRLQCETVQGGLKGNALLMQTAKKMYASGGVSAAYRGVTMGLVGMFPYSAIDMGMFELLKTTYRRYKARALGIHEDDARPGNIAMGMMGATSGAIGATIVYPLNVLRTRLQTQGTKMHPPTYTGIWDVTTTTVRNEGVRGLYKGLTPNLLKVAPALSITWIVYENSKKFLNLN